MKTATEADITSLKAAITALPKSVVHSEGNRTAMLARLRGIESEIARGNVAQAMHHLKNLRKWVDGCTSATGKAHGNDKLTDCAAQMTIRGLIDSVIDTLVDKLDTTPDVTINQASNQADPTSATPMAFTVVFQRAGHWIHGQRCLVYGLHGRRNARRDCEWKWGELHSFSFGDDDKRHRARVHPGRRSGGCR